MKLFDFLIDEAIENNTNAGCILYTGLFISCIIIFGIILYYFS